MNKKLILASIAIPSIVLGMTTVDELNLEKVNAQEQEYVYFEDKDLQAQLNIRIFGVQGFDAWTTPITKEQMATLDHVNIPISNITSLVGMEHAVNMNNLWIGGNDLSAENALEPIRNLKNLKEIIMNNSNLDLNDSNTIEIFSGLPNLKRLSIGGNNYVGENFDASVFKNLKNLSHFSLQETEGLKSISGLNSLPALVLIQIAPNTKLDKNVQMILEADVTEKSEKNVVLKVRTRVNNVYETSYSFFNAKYNLTSNYLPNSNSGLTVLKTVNVTSGGFAEFEYNESNYHKDAMTAFGFSTTKSNSSSYYSYIWETVKPELTVNYKGDGVFNAISFDIDSYLSDFIFVKGAYTDSDYNSVKDLGSKLESAEDNYVYENGIYTVFSVDNSNNVIAKQFEVTDLTVPVPELSYEDFNINVLNNENYNLYAEIDGEWLKLTENKLEITDNGIYSFKFGRILNSTEIFSDVGTINVTEIDKENLDSVNITPDKTEPTNTDVVVTLVSELGKEMYYSLNDGEFIKYENPVVFEDNGTIKAYSVDKSGNLSETKEYTVSNIDKIAPENPEVEQEVTKITNKSYNLKLLNQESGSNTLYKFNDSDWVTLDADKLIVVQNGEYSFKYVDQAGNESEITTLNIDNIDTINPENPVIMIDTTEPTNQGVEVTIDYSDDSSAKKYKIGNGEWLDYTGSITLNQNATIYAYGVDEAENLSEIVEYVISNIDKENADIITLTPDKTEPTNTDVLVTLNSEQGEELYYSVNDGEFIKYENPVVFEDNGTIKAYSVDDAGNLSEIQEYIVSNIDKENVDNVNIVPDKQTQTNDSVLITLTSELDKELYYSVNDGEFIKYENPVVFESNGHIKAYSVDTLGNMSETKEYTVSNIDKENVDNVTVSADETEPTNTDVLVTLTSELGQEIYYSVNDGEFIKYEMPVLFEDNGVIEAYSVDKAGNQSETVTYNISNIDKENVDVITINPNTTAPTNSDVLVTLTSDNDKEIYYSVNDGEFIKYENPVVFEDNGTIKAYSVDAVGNLSETKEYIVSNIDKISPETPELLQEVTEMTNKPYGLELLNQEAGANTLYKFNNNDWVILDTDVLNISQNGEYAFKYVDQAGNESEINTLNINNFDYSAEDFYLTKEEFNTHGDIYVNLAEDFSDDLFMLVDGEYIALENNKVQVYENGIYTFLSVDELGNEIIKDIEVNLVNIIPSIDSLDYDTVTNTPSVVDKLIENIENQKLDTPKDDEYYEYLLNHLAGLGLEELTEIKGGGSHTLEEVYKFATSGVLSSSDQIITGSGGFNTIYKLLNAIPSGTGTHTVIDLGTSYLLFVEDCGEDYIGGLTINDILEGESSPSYMKIINYIDGIPDGDTQNRLKEKLKSQIILLIEDCLDDPIGSGIDIKELAELCGEFGVLDEFGNFGGGNSSEEIIEGGSGGNLTEENTITGNFGSGSVEYIEGLIGGLNPDTLSVIGGQVIDYLNCGCLYIPDVEIDRLKKEFDGKIIEIFNNKLDNAKLNPTEDNGELKPLIEIITCGCMPKETEDYLKGLLEEYLKELITNSGSLQELDRIEQFTNENGFDLTEEIEEKRREFGLVESGGGTDTPEEPVEETPIEENTEEPVDETTEQPEITGNENIETDLIIPSDNGTNMNSNQNINENTESNNYLPQTGTEQGANAGILLLLTGLLGGLLIRRKQDKTE